MTERDDIPQAVKREHGKRSFPFVWIIPVLALLVGAWIAVKDIWETGPTITIQFSTAEGIEAGKTKIRHKAVEIGTVRSVKLSDDNKAALVTAQLDRKRVETATALCEPAPTAMADVSLLQQVLQSIVTNALDALPEGGKLEVKTAGAEGRVEIVVRIQPQRDRA